METLSRCHRPRIQWPKTSLFQDLSSITGIFIHVCGWKSWITKFDKNRICGSIHQDFWLKIECFSVLILWECFCIGTGRSSIGGPCFFIFMSLNPLRKIKHPQLGPYRHHHRGRSGYSPLQRVIIWPYMTGPNSSNTHTHTHVPTFKFHPNSIQIRFHNSIPSTFPCSSIFTHSDRNHPDPMAAWSSQGSSSPKKLPEEFFACDAKSSWRLELWPPAEISEKNGVKLAAKHERSGMYIPGIETWAINFHPNLKDFFRSSSLQVPSVQTSNYSRHSASEVNLEHLGVHFRGENLLVSRMAYLINSRIWLADAPMFFQQSQCPK